MESSQHQENQETPRTDDDALHPDVTSEDRAADDAAADGAEPHAASELPEIFLLDYDRELVYLEREGKLRGGRRPTGFKR